MSNDIEQTTVLTDLRKRFPVNKGCNSWEATTSLLLNFPPSTESTGRGELPTNGLDCLMQLVRHIHSRYPRVGRENELEIFLDERRNPLLELAWSSFDLAHGDGRERQLALLADEKEKVLQTLIRKGILDRNDLEGINLINSMLMNLSIWSRPGFRVYEKVLIQEPDTSQWQVVYRQGRDRDGILGNIDYNASDYPGYWKLQDVIDNHFGELVADDCNTQIWVAYPSAVVRIEYEPSPEAPGNFQDLRRFTVPLYTDTVELDLSYIYGSVPQSNSSVIYELVAVVKHQSRPGGRSYIRTYLPGGAHIHPYPGLSGIVDNNWHLDGATSGKYLLVYQPIERPLALVVLPEVRSGIDGRELLCLEAAKSLSRSLQDECD